MEIGTRLPFHATASGLAYLAFSGKKQIEAALSQPLEAFTENTVTDPAAVRKMIDETIVRGFSISSQGLEVGVVSTGAAILFRRPVRRSAPSPSPRRWHGRALATLASFGAAVAHTAKRISEKYYGPERPSGTKTRKQRGPVE